MVEGWQLVNACFFAGNVWAVRSLPRLDGRNSTNLPINFLTPAPYAFAIWGVIYMMELLFVIWQLLQGCGVNRSCIATPRQQLLKRLSPFWCGANACQIAWCFAFSPSLDTPSLLWISAMCLTGIASFLGLAHHTLSQAKREKGLTFEERIFMYVPLTLHFGWTTAASLVNWNGYVSRCSLNLEWPSRVKMDALLISLALAGLLGTKITLSRQSALYGLTVSWAVLAVASHSSTSVELRDEFPGGEAALRWVAQVEYVLGFSLIAVALFSGCQRLKHRSSA